MTTINWLIFLVTFYGICYQKGLILRHVNIETYVDTNVSNVVAFFLHDLVLHCSLIVNTQSDMAGPCSTGMVDAYCTGKVV